MLRKIGIILVCCLSVCGRCLIVFLIGGGYFYGIFERVLGISFVGRMIFRMCFSFVVLGLVYIRIGSFMWFIFLVLIMFLWSSIMRSWISLRK